MTKTEAINIIRSGKIFSCEFTKKDGSIRKLVGRTGVKPKKGGKLGYNAGDMGLITVFDFKKMEYRSVPVYNLHLVNGKKVG